MRSETTDAPSYVRRLDTGAPSSPPLGKHLDKITLNCMESINMDAPASADIFDAKDPTHALHCTMPGGGWGHPLQNFSAKASPDVNISATGLAILFVALPKPDNQKLDSVI